MLIIFPGIVKYNIYHFYIFLNKKARNAMSFLNRCVQNELLPRVRIQRKFIKYYKKI